MILSVSRRTDIPTYYTPWLLNRLREGYALVRNPMNPRRVSRVAISPDVVDCMVLWSKNPAPLLERLGALRGYAYYFQFTLNAYGRDIEPGLPPLAQRVQTFRRLAGETGPLRVVWRYDPILLNDVYTPAWHEEQFARLAESLRGHTRRVVISFVDPYAKTRAAAPSLQTAGPGEGALRALAGKLAATAARRGMAMYACAEEMDLSAQGILPSSCIDPGLIEQLTGCPLRAPKDKGQRPLCGCAASVDIGAYDTCPSGCLYCYANHGQKRATAAFAAHDPASPLLAGTLGPEDMVTERPAKSLKILQQDLFGI